MHMYRQVTPISYKREVVTTRSVCKNGKPFPLYHYVTNVGCIFPLVAFLLVLVVEDLVVTNTVFAQNRNESAIGSYHRLPPLLDNKR